MDGCTIIMCARYTMSKEETDVLRSFNVKSIDPFLPSYNTAPGMASAVITADVPDRVQQYHFGLVPHWAKDVKIGYKMFNARSETLLDVQSFKPLMNKGKRCLVLADGFYEWKAAGKEKLPYRFVLPKRELFAFAGLYSHWLDPTKNEWYRSFTIITTEPNNTVSNLHNRMPVILKKEDEQLWLAQDIPAKEVLPLLSAYPDQEMDVFRVSKEVNKAINNYADLMLPHNSQ
jgi:putative SOS response-associated peptidase YedK